MRSVQPMMYKLLCTNPPLPLDAGRAASLHAQCGREAIHIWWPRLKSPQKKGWKMVAAYDFQNCFVLFCHVFSIFSPILPNVTMLSRRDRTGAVLGWWSTWTTSPRPCALRRMRWPSSAAGCWPRFGWSRVATRRSAGMAVCWGFGGFRFVMGVPPVIIHFERWDFPL